MTTEMSRTPVTMLPDLPAVEIYPPRATPEDDLAPLRGRHRPAAGRVSARSTLDREGRPMLPRRRVAWWLWFGGHAMVLPVLLAVLAVVLSGCRGELPNKVAETVPVPTPAADDGEPFVDLYLEHLGGELDTLGVPTR